jgi:hypothetical protein
MVRVRVIDRVRDRVRVIVMFRGENCLYGLEKKEYINR